MRVEFTDMQTFLRHLVANLIKDVKILALLLGIPLLLSCPLYLVERGATGAKLTSWPEAMYLTWITLMTVGYGDLTPVTPCGRLIACVDAAFGIVLFGLVVFNVSKAREP